MSEITSKDIMHLGFLKLEKFAGSSEGMRFRMEKEITEVSPETEGKTEQKTSLLVTVWPEPFSYEHTPETAKVRKHFSFDEDGIEAGRQWLNEMKKENWDEKRLPFDAGE